MGSGAVARRLLRITLPLGALALIAAIFLFPSPQIGGLKFSGVGLDGQDGLRLESPVYSGVTDAGAPFTIISDWALPDGPDPERIDLGPARADVELSPDRSASLTADGGEFLPKRKQITLTGAVRGETSDGYRFEAPEAKGDFDAKTLAAQGPLLLLSPTARLEAGRLRARREEAGDVILFEEGVRLRINQDAQAEGEPE